MGGLCANDTQDSSEFESGHSICNCIKLTLIICFGKHFFFVYGADKFLMLTVSDNY